MAFHVKPTDLQRPSPSATSATKDSPAATVQPLDARLRRAKEHVDRGDYESAIRGLAADDRSPELRNTRAVCLMRTGQFAAAVNVFRTFVLSEHSLSVKPELPLHVKINYATALFYGGQPAGGVSVLDELNQDQHPDVAPIREACQRWVAGMGFFKRLDWRMNRIAPKTLPAPPEKPVGRFVWEVA